jgi:sialic acid synthase SpsE
LVAEIGSNHAGNAELAQTMVRAAAACGAGAVKFQAFQAETFIHPLSSYFKEFAAEELSFDVLASLMTLSHGLGLKVGLTVFDDTGLSLAKQSCADYVKISSGDLTNFPLIKAAAASGCPLVLSTGASNDSEVKKALNLAAPNLLALLQCTSLYPCPAHLINLSVLDSWLNSGLPAGLSDHAADLEASLAALDLGAVMVEKHFTVDRSLPGGDNSMSALPEEFSVLAEASNQLYKPAPTEGQQERRPPGPLAGAKTFVFADQPFWGKPDKKLQPGENPLLIRRVAVAAFDLQIGDRISPPGVIFMRPPDFSPVPDHWAPLTPDRSLGGLILVNFVAKGDIITLSDVDLNQ